MNFESKIIRAEAASQPYVDDEDVRIQKRRRWLIIGAAVLLVAIAAWFLTRNGSGDAPVGPGGNKQAPRVTVVVPGKQLISANVSATGSLAARREMPVGVVGEGGLVTRVWVEPGTWVGQGQVLATIERSVQMQESAQLSANINVAQADARIAQSELDRARSLVERGFISKADIDRKTATRDAANARVRVAQAQLGAARARVGRLDVRAPAAGLVLTRAVEPGQVVGAGSGVLFRIARGGELELRAQLAEADLARLTVGQAATVTPVGTSKAFNGQIWQMSPVIDPQTRQGTARIALSYDPLLRPGGFATAEITSGVVEAPLLPQTAVQSDAQGNYVFVITKDNKVERRNVKIGNLSDTGAAIAEGISGNEQVVLSAGAFLNPGETVLPVRQQPAAKGTTP